MRGLHSTLAPEHGASRRFKRLKLIEVGGDERDRTVGLLNAIEALSQLSYIPDTDSRRQGVN
jgi:hypothetical protein